MGWRHYRDSPPEWENERDYEDADWQDERMEKRMESERMAAEHEKAILLKLWEATSAINAAREEYNAMVNKDLMIVNNRAFVKAYLDVDDALTRFTIVDIIKNKE